MSKQEAINRAMRHRRLSVRWLLALFGSIAAYIFTYLTFGPTSLIKSVALAVMILCTVQMSVHRASMRVWEEIIRG